MNALAKDKLLSSGLTLSDARKLKITALPPERTAALHRAFKPLHALRIAYHGPDGLPLCDRPGRSPFYRLRYLEEPKDFGALTDKKPLRYVQEPNTAPVIYYPQNYPSWPALCKDVDEPLIITEGELKAAKACKEGFPAIGLGGVYNWRALKIGLTWLDSLDYIIWPKRNVYLVFDSDYQTNKMVCTALVELAREIERRGSTVYLVTLPQLPNMEKVGLDDYLVNAGPGANELFANLLATAPALGLSEVLWTFNSRYVYIKDPGLVVAQRKTSNKITPAAFKEHVEGTAQFYEQVLRPDGTLTYKATSAGGAWLKWPLRQQADCMTYIPGKKPFVGSDFNIWPGWGCKAVEGDVTPFMELLEHLFTGAEPGALEWLLKWCAYPLQYPGTKMFSSVVVHGVRHGTGKSLIGYTLAKIYGKNFTEINQMDLHNNFNEWAESKQFVMGDDVTGSNKRQDADFLKKMITQKELRINVKYMPSYVVPDCINYYFTSQHPDSFFLEDDDRRFFIHEVLVGPREEEFYTKYVKWLDNGGAEAVFYYLLHLDLTGFNPAAPAFRTKAKERMIDTGRSDLGSWVRQLIATPDQVLRLGDIVADKDLMHAKELLLFYDPEGRTGTTANGLGRELSRAGVRQVMDGAPIRLADGSQARYYAIRNADKWLYAQPHDIRDHIESVEKAPRRKSKRY